MDLIWAVRKPGVLCLRHNPKLKPVLVENFDKIHKAIELSLIHI